MHLREVTLRNWRSYRSATFRFLPPKKDRRVILVGAMNGYGKTSLLMALYLGLFGREAMAHLQGVKVGTSDEDTVRSYRQLMERILHRSALQAEDPHALVQLVFESADSQVTVARTWHFRKGGTLRNPDEPEGEEIRIEEGGRVQRPATWTEANNRISDLLFPAHVMPCFFFDGEQAQERVEASGGRALTDAIHALFGTTLVDDLNDSLRGYLEGARDQARRDVGEVDTDELDAKRRERSDIEGRVAQIGKDLRAVRSDLDKAETARKQRTVELTQLTGDSAIDLQQIAQKKLDLETEARRIQERLCDSLSLLALPVALNRHGASISRRLQGEIIRDDWRRLRDQALPKVELIVGKALPRPNDRSITPPLQAKQHGQLEDRLRTALESLWSPPPPGCAEDYAYTFLNGADRSAALQRMQGLMGSSNGGVVEQASQWQAIQVQLRDVQRKWEAVRDIKPKVEALKAKIDEAEARVKELNQRKWTLEREEQGNQSQLKDLSGAIAQMETMKRKLGPLKEKIDVIERVRSVIRDTRDRLVPLCKEALEQSCTKHFRAMITKEFRGYRLEFDRTDFQPRLVGAQPEPIFVSTLSGAQKRAFGLAFTLAVAEISGAEGPLVIDTPVGNMDSDYRKRILSYLAKAAPGQLIFLSHNEEIYGEYVRELEPRIVQKHLIEFELLGDGAGLSTVREGSYFG